MTLTQPAAGRIIPGTKNQPASIMKKTLAFLLTAAFTLAILPLAASAQTSPVQPFGQPTVLTKEQAQAQTKTQMANAQVQYIGILERGFDQISNFVTANSYHLTQADVTAGFGEAFSAQVFQEGTLMLSTIIKANKILGRTDRWLAQDWVVAWIAAYKLDPATGDPLPAQ